MTFGNVHVHGHVCGCYYTTGPSPSQLRRHYLARARLVSHTTITPLCFTTRLTQTFHNPSAEALPQVRYTFPLYDGVTVNGYTISYADKTLTGIVREKHEAKKTYQAAVDRGEAAGLLEHLPSGIFGVTLGNVPAHADVVVDITYCGELKHDAAIDGPRYTLPTTICPRYGDYPGEVLKSDAVVEGGISINIDIDMADSPIRKVQSPTHPIAVSMGALSTAANASTAPFTPYQASATLTLGSTGLGSDFILQMLADDISNPRAILETHPTLPDQRAIMATMVPKFTLEPAHPEIVFIADQSGSMSGDKNTALVRALKVFIKSLPTGVRFNICAFGTNFRFLWPTSQAYNESNVEMAIAFVESFGAAYGGTEILKPITATFEQRLGDMPLEVMLLTDGQIWGEDAVFEYVNQQLRDKRVDARVFALGIGSHVSHSLVEGVARAGNGFAQFVVGEEEMDQKVVRMLRGALYAHTKDYRIEVHYADVETGGGEAMDDDEEFEMVEKVNECLIVDDHRPKERESGKKSLVKSFFNSTAKLDEDPNAGQTDRYAHLPAIANPKILQAPATIPPLFPFNRTTVYLLLGPETTQKSPTSITLRATSSEGPIELTVPITTAAAVSGVATIHQLAARKAVQDLEEGRGWLQSATVPSQGGDKVLVKGKYPSRFDEIVEREAVRLGERFQVSGKWTSFVAVQDRENANEPEVDQVRVSQVKNNLRKFNRRSGGRVGPTYVAQNAIPPPPPAYSAPPMPPAAARVAHFAPPMRHATASMAQAAACASPAMPQHHTRKRQAAPSPPSTDQHDVLADVDRLRSAHGQSNAPPPPPPAVPAEIMQLLSEGVPRREMYARRPDPNDDGSPSAATSHGAAMHRLIGLQTFSGAWPLSDELLTVVGVDKSAVGLEDLDDASRATALAVAFLEMKVSDKCDVWEMVVAKARAWLGKHVGVDAKGVDELVGKAGAWL